MNIDFVNVITVITALITICILIHTIISAKAEKRELSKSRIICQKEMSDYGKILHSTHWLEKEREKNQGEHFEDETVYLNRAKDIRKSSQFFSWVNKS